MRYAMILLLLLCGCVESEPRKIQPKPQTRKLEGIVLVTMENCLWCEKQKSVLTGDVLKGARLVTVNHTTEPESRATFPAKMYPTMYIFFGNGRQHKAEGYLDRNELEQLIDSQPVY